MIYSNKWTTFVFDDTKISLKEFAEIAGSRFNSNQGFHYTEYLHCTTGPAITYTEYRRSIYSKALSCESKSRWFINGQEYLLEEWLNEVFPTIEERVEFKLQYV